MHRVKCIGLNRKVQQPKGQTTDLVAHFKFRMWQNGYSNNNELVDSFVPTSFAIILDHLVSICGLPILGNFQEKIFYPLSSFFNSKTSKHVVFLYFHTQHVAMIPLPIRFLFTLWKFWIHLLLYFLGTIMKKREQMIEKLLKKVQINLENGHWTK